MSTLANIINYFKACYQVDFKAINIINFFGKKVEHQLVIESTELISGQLMQYPISYEWGKEMESTLALNAQEKALYCCSFFLSGKMNIIGRSQKVFAPLYIYPVKLIQENDIYYLVLDVKNAVINPVFVDFIKTQISDINFNYDDLSKALPKGYIRFDEVHQIEATLKQFIPNLDVSALDNFDDLLSKEELTKAYNKRITKNKLTLLPGVGIGLLQKPVGSRGILNELTKMAAQDDFSNGLATLFSSQKKPNKKTVTRQIFTPVTLSKSQLEVFKACDNHQLSLVVGPPGTGKSFTIAALAVDLISRGQSVLIASKNNQAGAVIANKIEQDFGLKGVVVKTSNNSYKKQLQKRLSNIINGIEVQKVNKLKLDSLEDEITALHKEIREIETTLLKRETEEIKWGAFFNRYRKGFFQKFQKKIIEYKLNSREYVWSLMKKLESKSAKLHKRTKYFVRLRAKYHLYETLRHKRSEIQSLLKALNMNQGALIEASFNLIDFDTVLHALPAWIVNSSEIHKSLPLNKELFDVLIIDEATQCDIASSLPLLQRAKKIIIVGDPKQLRHISFLSGSQQQQLAKKHLLDANHSMSLDYRNKSLLDLVSDAITSQDQVQFLDEHYRSMPDIIHFSNRHFYENKLKIMTATPITLKEKSVFLQTVKDGKRNGKAYNEKEADSIVEQLKLIIEQEADMHKNLCQSIGILSPFRAQITHIKTKLRKSISAKDMKRHQLLVGTPHQFQGEERDIMMLSFVVDDDAHPSTYLYLNKHDVFNVSITRARSLQYIFTSVNIKNLKSNYLFTQYLQSINEASPQTDQLSNYSEADAFLEDVVKILKRWRVGQIYKSYPIAGIEIDIVVVQGKTTYCIDLIGYPGDYEQLFPLEQWKMLSRVGVKTFTLPYSAWYLNPTHSRKQLKQFLLASF